MLIDEYVHRLDRALTGPGRLKGDLLTETRHGLLDAAEGYREAGLPPVEAERQAVVEFGTVPELAPAYQAELAVGAARRLALRLALVPVLIGALAPLTWRGSPWASAGAAPPAGYRLISEAQDWLGPALAVLALLAYLLLRRSRRPEHAYAAAVGALASIGVAMAGGVAIYTWSALLWDGVLTWPPMIAGGLAIVGGYAWLARSALACVRAARVAPSAPL